MVNRGGLRVFTTIDLDYQHLAEKTAREQVDALHADGASNAALVAINPRTGEILAMLGSVDYDQPDWGQVNVAVAPRQPGSALKPIMYATALKKGYTAATMLPDLPPAFDSGAGQPPYEPTDYDGKYRGPVSMRTALANSLNVPAVDMLKQVGISFDARHGPRHGHHHAERPGALWAVGGAGRGRGHAARNDQRLRHLRRRRAAPAAGRHCSRCAAADGKILEKFDAARARAQPANARAHRPSKRYVITDILADNEARTPLFGANSPLRLSRPAAAKTGTTNDWKDSWTVGYNPSLVTGVWVGNNDNQEMSHVAGARGAGPIWHNFMETALGDTAMQAVLLAPGDTHPAARLRQAARHHPGGGLPAVGPQADRQLPPGAQRILHRRHGADAGR